MLKKHKFITLFIITIMTGLAGLAWSALSQPAATQAQAGVDLVPYRLEVTQSIQDLNNSVPLVAGKRSFVRFYVRSTEGNHRSFA